MTELGRHLTEETMALMMNRQKSRSDDSGGGSAAPPMKFKPVEAGAATQVWAATAPELVSHNGTYLADCQLGVVGENPTFRGFEPYALDTKTAGDLWSLSEKLVGETFAQ